MNFRNVSWQIILIGFELSSGSQNGTLSLEIDSVLVGNTNLEPGFQGVKRLCNRIDICWTLKNESDSVLLVNPPWYSTVLPVIPPIEKEYNAKTKKIESMQGHGVGNLIVYLRRGSENFFEEYREMDAPITYDVANRLLPLEKLTGLIGKRYFELSPGDYFIRLEYNTLYLPKGARDFWRGNLSSMEIEITIDSTNSKPKFKVFKNPF